LFWQCLYRLTLAAVIGAKLLLLLKGVVPYHLFSYRPIAKAAAGEGQSTEEAVSAKAPGTGTYHTSNSKKQTTHKGPLPFY
jgi:hypothetical protein